MMLVGFTHFQYPYIYIFKTFLRIIKYVARV